MQKQIQTRSQTTTPRQVHLIRQIATGRTSACMFLLLPSNAITTNNYLSPSPVTCNHDEQLTRIENKLDLVLELMQAKPKSQEITMPQMTTPPVLPPPQLPGPSHQHVPAPQQEYPCPQSSICSPQFSSELSEADTFIDQLCSLLSEDISTSNPVGLNAVSNPVPYSENASVPTSNYLPYGDATGATASMPPMDTATAGHVQQALLSPERAMTCFPGKDEKTLRALAVALAKDCIFGADVLVKSTRSGRGDKAQQLDPDKLNYIKHIIAGRIGKQVGDAEFELVWGKCLVSIGKQCQILRNKAKKRL